jgi:DNA-binding MarR family transcriptional regulator
MAEQNRCVADASHSAGSVQDVPRLARELGHLLDELLVEAGPSYVHASEERGLTAAQAHLLLVVGEAHGPVTVRRLAQTAHRSITGASRIIERLSRCGLVSGHEETGDRRTRKVEITAAGVAHLRGLRAERRVQLEHYIGAMNRAQRLRLAGALHLLSLQLDDLSDHDLRSPADAA